MSRKCQMGIAFLTVFLNALNPIIVFAAETVEETNAEKQQLGPVTSFIGLIVLVVVAYLVYHAMYSGSVIIGTMNGIAAAIGRRLVIPVIVGGLAAGLVIKILQYLGIILKIIVIILLIGAAVIGIYLLYCKVKGRNVNLRDISDGVFRNTVSDMTAEQNDNQTADNIINNESEQNDDKKESNVVQSTRINETDLIFCGGCGNEILRTVKFCPYCGRPNNYTYS